MSALRVVFGYLCAASLLVLITLLLVWPLSYGWSKSDGIYLVGKVRIAPVNGRLYIFNQLFASDQADNIVDPDRKVDWNHLGVRWRYFGWAADQAWECRVAMVLPVVLALIVPSIALWLWRRAKKKPRETSAITRSFN